MPANWPHKGDMVIGNDIWIGYGATLMPGVQIGSGATIASQSVVTKSVEPYTVVDGNPARVIRQRFDSSPLHALFEIQWWQWDIEKITRNLKAICGADLELLRQAR